jgi:hypothetical protein
MMPHPVTKLDRAGLGSSMDGWESQVVFKIKPDGKWEPRGTYGQYSIQRLAEDPTNVERDGGRLA